MQTLDHPELVQAWTPEGIMTIEWEPRAVLIDGYTVTVIEPGGRKHIYCGVPVYIKDRPRPVKNGTPKGDQS